MIKVQTRLKASTNLIDLTPLVDVVFLLLIFFIVTSDILPLKSLNIQNPEIERLSDPLTTQLLVAMDAQNVLYVGSKKAIVDMTSLKSTLEQEITQLKKQHPKANPTVVVSIDKSVEYGIFLRIFSIVQECTSHIRLSYQTKDNSHAEIRETSWP